jgi:xanthine dehydrogenase YagS FAD-binding subunit
LLDGGKISAARLALGGVGTVPWRSRAAEDALAGAAADDAAFARAAEVALSGAKPRKDNAFKAELAKRAIVRALRSVCGGAR